MSIDQPEPPESIPKYIHEGMQKQGTETLEDIIEYAEQLIDHQESEIMIEADEGEEIVNVEEKDSYTIVEKMVPCGKDNCSTCPHGPYKYKVYREGDKVKWDYIGKE